MNRTKLKNYAPQARKDFIQAVTAKAAQYGLAAAKIEPMMEKGDVVLISGKPFPKAVGDKRKRLEDRIKKNGFEYTMEAMAYTWFNRLVAVRYMELHGYLEHGFRVLSHPEGHAQPEILEKAQYVDLPGLDQKKVIEFKLDGTKEEDLYRLLLTAQFNALSKAMPFLFEKIDDETELLLPDSLLNSDSLIRKLVTEIDEEDWKEVEIIGWLYQFYISDKKDEVIGKVVKSEDIPAATQLFTPNWIVKYLVQNTIGRQWLATYPQSSLRSKMEYYIEPAEQTPEVQEQLNAITPTSLNPEELTLLDPACGSGHILVEAYDLFKTIYEERGYRAKDIPALILQKNLFGLEIDDRAAQLAAFALMMKARADYPRIFDSDAQPNVVSFVESKGLDADGIHYALMSPLLSEKQVVEPPRPDGFLFETEDNLFTHAAEVKATQTKANILLPDITKEDIASLVGLFENAKTFGSLIQVPSKLAEQLPDIAKRVDNVLAYGDLTHSAAQILSPILQQANLLVRSYDAVVANPPYMNTKTMCSLLRDFISRNYADGKTDLYSAFILRAKQIANKAVGLVAMQTWMFLSSFAALRRRVLEESDILSLIHLGPQAFPEITGHVVQTAAFVLAPSTSTSYIPTFVNLSDLSSALKEQTFNAFERRSMMLSHADLLAIPDHPIAYWISRKALDVFRATESIGSRFETRAGMSTSDNDRFLRFWFEVPANGICDCANSIGDAVASQRKWFPYNKGGGFKRWYGNNLYVVNYQNDGEEIKHWLVNNPNDPTTTSWARYIRSPDFYFRPCITWSLIAGDKIGFRMAQNGSIIGHKGPGVFCDSSEKLNEVLGVLNSTTASYYLSVLRQSLGVEVGHVNRIPFVSINGIAEFVKEVVQEHMRDECGQETAPTFDTLFLIKRRSVSLSTDYRAFCNAQSKAIEDTKATEEKINKIVLEAYGLTNEIDFVVLDDQITLYRPDRAEDIKRLISYAIGCIVGRYSLDKPGLIYAHSGNGGFDPSQYNTFRADDDGIVPLLDSDWGIRDDAANRIVEFVSLAWPKEHLDENLKFIADSLSPSNGEQPKDTIRRYLATGFYKHHMSIYKKRPIYWMFSSGKQRAFQCLVYLHRYNEGTLARMRTEYVIPLMGKMSARLEHLQGPPDQKGTGGEIAATSAVTVKRKLEKERDNIKKQLAELQAFDEKLRHYADLRIKLDLDDGVKVNYGKFSDPEIGDILAEVKAICGTKDED